jgi:hypothetical protein
MITNSAQALHDASLLTFIPVTAAAAVVVSSAAAAAAAATGLTLLMFVPLTAAAAAAVSSAAAAAAAAAAGLTLQLCGIGLLFGWQDSWAANGEVTKGILFVTAAQMLCGVAKDLTKLGGKTVTKLVTPDEREVRAVWLAMIITLLLLLLFEGLSYT